MAIFSDEAFNFYEGLLADPSKTYWTAHKHIYDEAVRQPFQELFDKLAPAFDADVTIFRPYRDVRFTKDKNPYKTEQGGFLEVGPSAGYYLQLDAEGLLVGGGFWSNDRAQVNRYRAAVDDSTSGPELVKITDKLVKAGFEVGGQQVATRPRGVPADHPRLDLMRREYVTVSLRPDPASLTPKSLEREWRKLTPLISWVLAYARPEQEPERGPAAKGKR